jgi:hypothetical protein
MFRFPWKAFKNCTVFVSEAGSNLRASPTAIETAILPWSITPRAIELDKRVVSGFFVSKQPQDCLALRLVRLFRQHLPIAIEVLLVNELFHLHHPCWR